MKLTIALLAATLAFPAFAAKNVNVRGHVTKQGTYVAPSVRTAPNRTKIDNYSTKGNVNPMTGKEGTKAP